MKTTITEEYEDGQLVRRTTVTEGQPATGGYVGPTSVDEWARYFGTFMADPLKPYACTCGPWHGVTAPPPCPVHGQAQTVRITCSSNTTPEKLAEQVGMELRRIA